MDCKNFIAFFYFFIEEINIKNEIIYFIRNYLFYKNLKGIANLKQFTIQKFTLNMKPLLINHMFIGAILSNVNGIEK